MDLLSVVQEPTWKALLIDLVASRKMDPWDIDIAGVADGYLQMVRQLQALDLRVPANVILACALMLKFKSETLKLEEEPLIEEAYFEERTLIDEDIPELVYRPEQARERKLTLDELVNAVEQVIKDRPREGLKIPVPKTLEINFPRIDTGELIQKIYDEADKIKDGQKLVLFSSLVENLMKYHQAGTLEENGAGESITLELKKVPLNSTGEAKAFYFVPVLHLVQQNKAIIWQEECFSEIFVKVLDEQETAARMQKEAGGGEAEEVAPAAPVAVKVASQKKAAKPRNTVAMQAVA